MTAPNPTSRVMEAQLADILDRLAALETGSRSSQLGNSSLDGSVLRVRALDGTTIQSWGMGPDGTATTTNTDPKVPPRPNTPVVTSAIGGVTIEWNGNLIQPLPGNFSHVTIHVSPVEGFAYSEGNKVGALYQKGLFAVETDYVTQYVKLVAWTTSGVPSEPSAEQHASPGKVVADEVLDGIVGELALADEAVKAAKLATGAVTSTKVADNAITTPKIVAGAVQAGQLATGSVTTEKLLADAITAEKIAALAITSDKLTANAVTAGKIEAGAVKASHLESTLVLGNRLIAGSPTASRVEMSSSGLLVVRDDGDTTFSIDASTGDVVSMGEYYTSRYGERIAMNSGGLSSPMIRAYPDRGSNYASLGAKTSSTPSGERVAYWGFRVPYLNTALVGFVEFMAENSASKANIDSSKLWYRPYVAADGGVIPGWQAFGQDVALTFADLGLYSRSNDNSQYRDVLARSFYGSARGSFNNLEITGNSMFSRDRDGALRWDATGALEVCTRSGAAGRGVYATNFAPWGSSWRGLKIDRRSTEDYLGASALDIVRGLEIGSWRYDPDLISYEDDAEHYGLMLDDLPEPLVLRSEVVGIDGEPEDRSSYDLQSIANLALAAIQDQDAELAALRDEVAGLRGEVAALTERITA